LKDIKEEILQIWDHAGLDAEVDARTISKELNIPLDLSKAGSRSGRQLQHAQIGNAFGREGVLGAISNNVDGITLSQIASKNNVAAKKISAGIITKIVYSLLGNSSTKSLYFPVMWKPIINYFLGKMFGDKSITKEEYEKGIKMIQINESTSYKLDKQVILENMQNIKNHIRNHYGKYIVGAGAIASAIDLQNDNSIIKGAANEVIDAQNTAERNVAINNGNMSINLLKDDIGNQYNIAKEAAGNQYNIAKGAVGMDPTEFEKSPTDNVENYKMLPQNAPQILYNKYVK